MIVKFIHNQPIIDIDDENFGLNRDRQPDADWGELRRTRLTDNNDIKEIDISLTMNQPFKQILLEDLAYTFGNDTIKFRNKLIEFKLI